MIIVEADGFRFSFPDALGAFVFDEKDPRAPTYHGQPMKAVDLVAEFEHSYVFVEVKDFADPQRYDLLQAEVEAEGGNTRDAFNWLKNYLKYKYRDSYLFRHAEDKVDRPIHYLCLLSFNDNLNQRLQSDLRRELPVGRTSPRWVRSLAADCHVVNLKTWNQRFPNWQVTRV